MDKRKASFIIGSFLLVLMLGSSLVIASSENIISDFFKEKNLKLEDVNGNDIIVESKDFKILKKEYVDFKENLSLVEKINGVPLNLSSEQIIEQMIENKLLSQSAKKSNTIVTDSEIMDYALQTKKAVEQSDVSAIHDIHAALANDLNVSLNEYFTHPDVLKQYENVVLIDKYVNKLYEQEVLDENRTIEDFTKKLMEENQDFIDINQSMIQEIK